MNTIDKLAENLASSIIDEKFLNKDGLKLKIKVFLKTMLDMKSIEYSSSYKSTTLDFVSSVANKNKFKSIFWMNKVKDNSPDKMKGYYNELKELLSKEDFSSHRIKKAKNLGMSDL